MTVDEAIAFLDQRKRDMRRSELEALLKEFGFKVKPCKKGNHRSFVHHALAPAGFYGGGFDGAHGADAQVRLPYVLDVRRIFQKYRAELKALRGEK